jgi:hypothetical protein
MNKTARGSMSLKKISQLLFDICYLLFVNRAL